MTKFNTASSHSNVQELATKLGLSENAYSRALQLAELAPGRTDWLRYINHFLATIGALKIGNFIYTFIVIENAVCS
jgi:hypothetical protein